MNHRWGSPFQGQLPGILRATPVVMPMAPAHMVALGGSGAGAGAAAGAFAPTDAPERRADADAYILCYNIPGLVLDFWLLLPAAAS